MLNNSTWNSHLMWKRTSILSDEAHFEWPLPRKEVAKIHVETSSNLGRSKVGIFRTSSSAQWRRTVQSWGETMRSVTLRGFFLMAEGKWIFALFRCLVSGTMVDAHPRQRSYSRQTFASFSGSDWTTSLVYWHAANLGLLFDSCLWGWTLKTTCAFSGLVLSDGRHEKMAIRKEAPRRELESWALLLQKCSPYFSWDFSGPLWNLEKLQCKRNAVFLHLSLFVTILANGFDCLTLKENPQKLKYLTRNLRDHLFCDVFTSRRKVHKGHVYFFSAVTFLLLSGACDFDDFFFDGIPLHFPMERKVQFQPMSTVTAVSLSTGPKTRGDWDHTSSIWQNLISEPTREWKTWMCLEHQVFHLNETLIHGVWRRWLSGAREGQESWFLSHKLVIHLQFSIWKNEGWEFVFVFLM